jgi:sulfide:quinone oxidoreductase
LTKFIQTDDPSWKIALISGQGKFVLPDAYFGCTHGHIPPLKLESGSVSGQVEAWSRTDVGVRVTKYLPNENKLVLNNDREYTYKALVLAPGFDHSASHIEGLPEMRKSPEEDNVFVHMLDNKETSDRNYYHGWNHTNGDMICYSPQGPYKGEGTDFWALYYESFLRQDKLQGRAAANARIQYWTPNKEIYRFPYANEVALEECHKRGIDVMFGWEMLKVHRNQFGEKIATFRNVDNGAILEKPFTHANINPPSRPHKELVESGIVDFTGLIDVNPYTLQHCRYENIFAFGDAIKGETTRTQHAAVAQCPVVKHNLFRFMDGQELNGVYDGYSYMPFYLSHSNASCFQHHWDYEPATRNHWVPNYGLFSNMYFKNQLKSNLNAGHAYTGLKKDHGPPHKHFNQQFDPLDKNEYLQQRGVDVDCLRNLHSKKVSVA